MIKVEYDKKADAAYIYLVDREKLEVGWVKKTYPCDPIEVNGMINLDFNAEGQLGGIEIIDASKKLPKEILENVDIT